MKRIPAHTSRARNTVISAMLLTLPLAASAQRADNPDRIYQLSDLKQVSVTAGKTVIKAFICDNDTKRQEGMMFLTDREVKATEGFLFAFPRSEPRSFWMRNTVIPLDIIYLDSKGKVLNIQKGEPFKEFGLPSDGPSQYVLELKGGYAAKYGIKKGSILKFQKVRGY